MKIELDENWSILADTYSWKLEFSEPRVRDKKDKEHKKTGEKEDYIFTDAWYYPKISTCIETYLENSAKKAKTVEELADILNRIHAVTDNLKNNTFKPCK